MGSLDPKGVAVGLVRIGDEAIARPNDAALDEYFAEDFVFHGPDGDATLDDLKRLWAGMREAFSDFSVARDQILVHGNFVAARTRMSGIFERDASALLPRERGPPMPGFYREITGVSGLKPDWC